VSEPKGRSKSEEDILHLPATVSQLRIQRYLDDVCRKRGLAAAMERLYQWELQVGYISEEKLRENERHTFKDPETGICFRLQLNVARSRYTPTVGTDQNLPPLHCIICRENVGRPGKEYLRVFDFLLGGEPYFLQLTPFPLFTHHFVLITTEPKVQNVNLLAVTRMFQFLSLVPEYTICSNSDVEWAGSSILEHQHFQVFKALHLPVMDATALSSITWKRGRIRVDILDYPIAVLRVHGSNEISVERTGASLIETWKMLDPGRNTVNLVLRRGEGGSNFYVFLRNPDFRTPAALQHIKSEGVGVIEAAGEIILPVPKEESTLRRIRAAGLDVIRGILEGNNPVRNNKREQLEDVVERTLKGLMEL
jgi:UDPglucose--hexose-1-phosphate uridylyltransferase